MGSADISGCWPSWGRCPGSGCMTGSRPSPCGRADGPSTTMTPRVSRERWAWGRLGDATVTVTLGGEVVAFDERVLASHVTVTDPVHDQARQAARARAGMPKAAHSDEVEVRNLAVYDEATGAA